MQKHFLLGFSFIFISCSSLRPSMTFTFQTGPLNKNAKVFLIAGSSANSNFIEEILEQKNILKSLGVKESEISCYYVAPTSWGLYDDWNQFSKTSKNSQNCYHADVKNIKQHLLLAAKNKPPYIYLYITSHGTAPAHVMSERIEAKENKKFWEDVSEKIPYLNQHWLSIDGYGGQTVDFQYLIEKLNEGERPENIFLTVSNLKELLNQFPTETKKHIILQGCFSGGFIENEKTTLRKWGNLTHVKNISILTASSSDKTSFGCNPGNRITFFGQAFNEILKNEQKVPSKTHWASFYQKISNRVGILEKENSLTEQSTPLFFSNITP